MNFPVNSTILDLIFIILIITMMIFGYIKGFIVRLYSFITTLATFVIALFLSAPLSLLLEVYSVPGLFSFLGTFINRFIVFGILFVILKILFGLIGIVVKPTLQSVINKIGLVSTFNRLLGAILSFIEAIFICYIALLISISPVFSDGKEVVDGTIFAKHTLNLAPSISQQVEQLTDDFNLINDIIEQGFDFDSITDDSMNQVLPLLDFSTKYDLLTESQLEVLTDHYIGQIEALESPIYISQENKATLDMVLNRIDISEENKLKILEKIIVSE